MDKNLAQTFYLREDIQKALLSFAKDREIGVRFDGYFGKRPDVLEYLSDIKILVKKGVFSFHMSEEIWANPLMLGNDKLSEDERAKNRIGWDLILDLDGVDFEFAKITGKIIIDFLYDLGIKNISTKFSGNKGFHIAIPFQAFSKNIIGIGETRLLFPEAPRKIASYLMHELKGKISSALIEKEGSIENLSKKYNIPVEDLIIEDEQSKNLNFMKLIEIDTILIASRHLFRMPYSFNEKSGLISIPIKNEEILNFNKEDAKPQNVNPDKYKDFDFLAYNEKYGTDADVLLVKAYEDDYSDMISLAVSESEKKSDFTFEITGEVDIKDFPQTIQFTLNNDFADGRKRALFLLLTYLYSIKYSHEDVLNLINEWNEKQSTPLKQNYIKAQISWFKAKEKPISPPNFTNDNYYKGIGIPNEIITKDINKFKTKVKNPLHYSYLFLQKKGK